MPWSVIFVGAAYVYTVWRPRTHSLHKNFIQDMRLIIDIHIILPAALRDVSKCKFSKFIWKTALNFTLNGWRWPRSLPFYRVYPRVTASRHKRGSVEEPIYRPLSPSDHNGSEDDIFTLMIVYECLNWHWNLRNHITFVIKRVTRGRNRHSSSGWDQNVPILNAIPLWQQLLIPYGFVITWTAKTSSKSEEILNRQLSNKSTDVRHVKAVITSTAKSSTKIVEQQN